MKFRVFQACVMLLLITLFPPVLAFSNSSGNTFKTDLDFQSPISDTVPIKPQPESDRRKNQRADKLSRWVLRQLEANHVQVAILSRIGSNMVPLFDKTGMTHSGYVFRHPRTHEWTTYSLYADPTAGYKKSKVWQQSIKGFYEGQSGRKTDTLMFIPGQAMQEKLYTRLTSQPFRLLLPLNEHYNLVAPIESPNSFNCTKWVLLQYFATKYNSSDTAAVIRKMAQDYPVPNKKPGLIVRSILKRKPDVTWAELTPPNRVHTTTVMSMYRSSLFEKKLFYHDTNRL